jgi:hypothetical protein
MLAVTKGPIKVGSSISPWHLMIERHRAIENLWIFYSKKIGISEILVTIAIVFVWHSTLNLSYIDTATWGEEWQNLVFPVK